MRTGAAAGHQGFFHETLLYGSDDELLSVVVPFLDEAADAGEPAVLGLGAAERSLVVAAVRDPSALSFRDVENSRPSSVIGATRELLAEHVARGASQIRLVGAVPHPGTGMPWGWWARYEAAINRIYEEFPVWGLCPYDTRVTPDHVRADVERTHPHIAGVDGRHLANHRFEQPELFLTHRSTGGADPLEAAPPTISLVDPTPGAARRAVRDIGDGGPLDADDIDDLVTAVSEAVTNGFCHGRPPVHLRMWAGPDRIVVTVTDQGRGPSDPFAGLLPITNTSSGGLGLWLAHEICSHVTFDRSDGRFTLRLVAGAPHLA